MLQKEFFDRTGLQISESEYVRVDSMYNYCGNMDKDQFCADYKKHKDSTILNTYADMFFEVSKQNNQLKEERKQLALFIITQAEQLDSDTMRDKAISMIGFKSYAREVLRMGQELKGKYLEQMIELLDNIS